VEVERLLVATQLLLDGERGPRSSLSSLSTAARGLIAALVAVLAVGGVFWRVRRADLAFVPGWQLALAGASYAVVLGFLLWRILLPLHRLEARPEHAGALLGTAFGLPFMWALMPPHAFARVLQAADIRHDCLPLGLVIGGAFVALLRVLDRAADRDPRGIAMGAAAGGLVANLALAVHCPETRVLHLVIAHAPIGLLLFWLYRRAARWGTPRGA
jgi:hypothetical protein